MSDDDIFDISGGMFDLDNDGELDPEELAMIADSLGLTKDDETDDDFDDGTGENYDDGLDDVFDDGTDDDFGNDTEVDDFSWRQTAEGGEDYGIYPEDYDNIGEYTLAVMSAIQDALCTAENTETEDEETDEMVSLRAGFISDNPDLIAARYCHPNYGFDVGRAVVEDYGLPQRILEFCDFDGCFYCDVSKQIAECDPTLAAEVFGWLVMQFAPYSFYDREHFDEIAPDALGSISIYTSDEFSEAVILYLDANPEVCDAVLEGRPDIFRGLCGVIFHALQSGKNALALRLFNGMMNNENIKMKHKSDLINDLISACRTWNELETMETFRDTIFPVISLSDNFYICGFRVKWEQQICDYINHMEKECEKYRYTRRYAWREKYKENEAHDPIYYETEDEYLAAMRTLSAEEEPFDFDQYDNIDDFRNAASIKRNKQDIEKKINEKRKELADLNDELHDERIYTYCAVLLPFRNRPYHYRTEDETLNIGDTVLVPVGDEGDAKTGKIVSVEHHTRISVPYPLDRTKFILSKAKPSEE